MFQPLVGNSGTRERQTLEVFHARQVRQSVIGDLSALHVEEVQLGGAGKGCHRAVPHQLAGGQLNEI